MGSETRSCSGVRMRACDEANHWIAPTRLQLCDQHRWIHARSTRVDTQTVKVRLWLKRRETQEMAAEGPRELHVYKQERLRENQSIRAFS